jgi:methyl-CpG-binding domain protein 4
MERKSSPVTRLIQHDYARDPWRVLACCIMLNRTGGKQVRHVLDDFFSRWPDPAAAAGADEDELRGVLRHLGLHNRRASSIKRFSVDFLAKEWKDPRELHGIGLYGWEAYQIVCLGNNAVAPTDKVLGRYLEYVNADGNNEEAEVGEKELLTERGRGDGSDLAIPGAAGRGCCDDEPAAAGGLALRKGVEPQPPVAGGGRRRRKGVVDCSRTNLALSEGLP